MRGYCASRADSPASDISYNCCSNRVSTNAPRRAERRHNGPPGLRATHVRRDDAPARKECAIGADQPLRRLDLS